MENKTTGAKAREKLMSYFKTDYYIRYCADEREVEREVGYMIPIDKILRVPADMCEVIEEYEPGPDYYHPHVILYHIDDKWLLYDADYGSCGMCADSIDYLVFNWRKEHGGDHPSGEPDLVALRGTIEDIVENLPMFDSREEAIRAVRYGRSAVCDSDDA